MRSNEPFPIRIDRKVFPSFLIEAWEKGWLNEYSNNHFLIKALKGEIDYFVGKEQLILNNYNLFNVVNENGIVDTQAFSFNYCINLSQKLQSLVNVFGENQIERFIRDQLSAGKDNYNEDAFFQALSEISVLSFYANRTKWKNAKYEPVINPGKNMKNPEASFFGEIPYYTDDMTRVKQEARINIEVKTPKFPYVSNIDKSVIIPTVLLTNRGRKEIGAFCKKNDIKCILPRILKICDFLNSASEKLAEPEYNEFNILYINWSYSDYPINGFLEAWSLLTNDKNGVLTHPQIGKQIGLNDDVYKKITAVIVYTESLEGLMFSDFRFVWQRNGAGPRFRMWVLNEELRKAKNINMLSTITGMNSDLPGNYFFLKSNNNDKRKIRSNDVDDKIKELIEHFSL